jgi:membrane protein YdbS with pleckstrin-like domain
MEKENNSWGTFLLVCLTVVLFTLKLIGTITISWWWVFSPLWIPMALVFVVALITGIGIGIIEVRGNRK